MVPYRNQHGLMPSLTIKGISDELLKQLKQSAAESRRSLNGEVLYRLARSVKGNRINVEDFLRSSAERRARLALPGLDDDLLRGAKENGRA